MGGAGGGGGSGKVEVVESKGCSKLLIGLSTPMSSMRSLHPFEPMSPASSSLASETFTARSGAPFAGLVICVTGLSKGIKFLFFFFFLLISFVFYEFSNWLFIFFFFCFVDADSVFYVSVNKNSIFFVCLYLFGCVLHWDFLLFLVG